VIASMENLKKKFVPDKVVVPVRMTPEEREQLNQFYKETVHKSRSDYILAVLKAAWTE
tara:strand:+ start:251 stop:424 length:174 start_codon:yes stop_codon:yes gene_type:complete